MYGLIDKDGNQKKRTDVTKHNIFRPSPLSNPKGNVAAHDNNEGKRETAVTTAEWPCLPE